MFGLLHRANAHTERSARLESLFLVAIFHIPLTLLFAAIIVKSMSWETVIDTPMFMYTGFLMDKFGMAPMLDFFTYNMPGTHVLFRWLYHFFGGSVLGIRLADTSILALILVSFALALKPFGWRVAWAGAALFGIFHVTLGQHCYLQRDYIGLLPILLAVLSSAQWFGTAPRLRWFATGLFLGLVMAIKPHLIVGGLVLFAYMLVDTDAKEFTLRDWVKRAAKIALWCTAGVAVPCLWMAAYLAYYGQLGAFVNVVIEYFPMHADISGDHAVFEQGEKLPYIVALLFKQSAWDKLQLAFGAGAGLSLFLAVPTIPAQLRKYGTLLAILTVTYMIYPAIAARFYEHHYYPFRLFATVWLAFCLYQWSSDTPVRVRVASLGIAFYVMTSMLYLNEEKLLRPPSRDIGYPRSQRIAEWLKPRLQPGDTVQPIEWAFCGITHALLMTEAKVATHTVWGEVFFHHVSHPFVKNLRKDFLDQLAVSKPRFIIWSRHQLDYVKGLDSTREFPELEEFLAERYFPALDAKEFRIWESNASPTASEDRRRFEERHQRFLIDHKNPASNKPTME